MECTICGKTFYIFKQYIIHLKYAHNQLDYYVCPVNDCKRTYNTTSSFKYHLTTIHDYFIHERNKYIEILNVRRTDELVSTSQTVVSKHFSEDRPDGDVVSVSHKSVEFEKVLSISTQKFLAELYENLNLPRTTVQKLIKSVNSLLYSVTPVLKESVHDLIKTDNESRERIYTMLNMLQHCFSELDTDYKRNKFLTHSGKYIEPLEVNVGVYKRRKRLGKKGVVCLTLSNSNVYIIPLGQTLELFLEMPNVLETILNYQDKLNTYEKCVLGNVVHGTLWQNISSGCKDICIPIILYCDDFESGNPLGSHAGQYKICGVYASIATIPPELSSKLENVFMVMLFYSHYRVQFGNESVFKSLIEELKKLHLVGVPITSMGKRETTVRFYVAAIAGDNLGLHGILGFQESFSANNYCRFCLLHKNDCSKTTVEKEDKIRRKDNYFEHLSNNIGVKEISVWHSLDYFHVYENWTCDVMHDLCEGIHRYGMALIIKHLVNEAVIDLKHLNSRIKYFNYQTSEKNHPPEITQQFLNNGAVICSASEMLCLVRNFRFIIGDLVESDNDVWGYYLLLLELTEILTSQVVTLELLEYLQILIEDHHITFLRIFETTLKPKHHFLTHYISIIKKIGPPILISAFKFEAKHKEMKRISHSITCRKNLPLSIARRYQLKCCQRFLHNKGLEDSITFGKKLRLSKSNECFGLDESYFSISWYKINGVTYERQNVLLYNYEQDIPEFVLIDHIFVKNTCDDYVVKFIGKKLIILCYSLHYKAYSIIISEETVNCELNDCYSTTPTIIHKVGTIMLINEVN